MKQVRQHLCVFCLRTYIGELVIGNQDQGGVGFCLKAKDRAEKRDRRDRAETGRIGDQKTIKTVYRTQRCQRCRCRESTLEKYFWRACLN